MVAWRNVPEGYEVNYDYWNKAENDIDNIDDHERSEENLISLERSSEHVETKNLTVICAEGFEVDQEGQSKSDEVGDFVLAGPVFEMGVESDLLPVDYKHGNVAAYEDKEGD